MNREKMEVLKRKIIYLPIRKSFTRETFKKVLNGNIVRIGALIGGFVEYSQAMKCIKSIYKMSIEDFEKQKNDILANYDKIKLDRRLPEERTTYLRVDDIPFFINLIFNTSGYVFSSKCESVDKNVTINHYPNYLVMEVFYED